ncbi:GlxA family transcriptional regulator [Kordiimonas sp.]|uniref:GlxA family transcriptional regulator n=1 Tax=Kordiimonas sp. TaxID=1970157 RepID=UPI003A91E92E
MTINTPHKLILLTFDGAQVLDITGPAQVFASANEALEREAYKITLVSSAGQRTATSAGIALETTALSALEPEGVADTLMVAGGHGTRAAVMDDELIDWVKRAAEDARRVASVCSGTFILAAAGLLKGRRASTHWQSANTLARLYPGVSVDADAIYVEDGPYWTSAGVTAGIDMSLAMVERDHGRELAMTIARRLVVYARRPGYQSQFSTLLRGQSRGSAPVAKAIGWMVDNMKSTVTVTGAADHVGMSERSFHRRFVAETNSTPAKYLERLRLDAARLMLEETSEPLKTVAAEAGFGTAPRLIQVFEKRFGLSPTAYRNLHKNQNMG